MFNYYVFILRASPSANTWKKRLQAFVLCDATGKKIRDNGQIKNEKAIPGLEPGFRELSKSESRVITTTLYRLDARRARP